MGNYEVATIVMGTLLTASGMFLIAVATLGQAKEGKEWPAMGCGAVQVLVGLSFIFSVQYGTPKQPQPAGVTAADFDRLYTRVDDLYAKVKRWERTSEVEQLQIAVSDLQGRVNKLEEAKKE